MVFGMVHFLGSDIPNTATNACSSASANSLIAHDLMRNRILGLKGDDCNRDSFRTDSSVHRLVHLESAPIGAHFLGCTPFGAPIPGMCTVWCTEPWDVRNCKPDMYLGI